MNVIERELVAAARKQRRERSIQAEVLKVLRLHGVLAWGFQRERAGRARASHIGFKGCPDILGFLPNGRGLAVEVKRPRENLTVDQRAAGVILTGQGVVWAVVHSTEETINLLRSVGLRA